ncbi:MAG: prepilin-type N-terminal cleavage/methylation domain-containing protein [Candidatus Buchananbacteria bacterium]|nr:prepilin-type N-terminal cleavage/methylation domain-containing protein [Candidatus Buchananbacteria bacterium]
MTHSTQRGFTLVEVLVALSLFSVLMVVVSGVFINMSRLHQTTVNLQRLQSEGRYIVEKLARDIRTRQLVYPLAAANPQDELHFFSDLNGETLTVRHTDRDSDGILDTITYDIDGQTAPLNAADVDIAEVSFFVAPTRADQWGEVPISNRQPRVTVRLKLRNHGVRPDYMQTFEVQTTISSKLYVR